MLPSVDSQNRKIIKIAVTENAKAIIEAIASEHDMTEQGVASRIYEWFGRQSDEIQRGVLGLYGTRGPDIIRLVLQDLASPPKEQRMRAAARSMGRQLGSGPKD
jgi:hypothetical protein